MTETAHNYSYQAIPAAFAFSFLPHGYYLTRLMMATKFQFSTAMPRTNLETWKGKLPQDVWNQLVRARGAHLNCMEVFPLFAAAMVAGNVAKLPAKDLNSAALNFFVARTVYTALYITVKNDVVAFARTGAYFWSIGIPMMTLWRAGQAASQDI
ncbi:uncharacterized protein RCC_08540 [Ramularia collo-cygni]|uniref:Uncharacterized protein n=1 Tax=Ramularia collo-cygni TaxID=112498 RepID=A0A2D3VKF6_9PEZI|nr:uncharacterized protein RCC_08540 [Ramularia collo-cygni]CZT22834.1 uncharacterized protein RCC_08540 [Ramularia collo-cygni]